MTERVHTFGVSVGDVLSRCSVDERAIPDASNGEIVGGVTSDRVQGWIMARAARVCAVLESKDVDPALITAAAFPGARAHLADLVAYGAALDFSVSQGDTEQVEMLRPEWRDGMSELKTNGLASIGAALAGAREETAEAAKKTRRLRRG